MIDRDNRASPAAGFAIDRTLSEAGETLLVTRSGVELRLRPVRIDDAVIVADLFEHLGEQELGFRFLSGMRHIKPHQVTELLQVDHRSAEHLLGFVGSGDRPVASLMIGSDRMMEVAEVAIVIDRDWHGKGIGWTLLHHAADLARERGFKVIRSIESRANHEALEVERAAGFKAVPYGGEGGLIMLEAQLA